MISPSLLFLCPAAVGLAWQDPYTPKVAEASGEGLAAIAGFEVPEGFAVAQWAAEPMLANPVAFHVDHRGDVFVCESFRVHAGVTDMREHMDWLADELDNLTVADRVAMYRLHEGEEGFLAYGTEHERVRLLRDTDGDRVADVVTVFADGFKDPADGIAAGVLSYKGDVFYTCIPHLWRLRDADADGVAQLRDILWWGYGVLVALLGHDMHGLCIGPDGRLYWSIGDRGFRVEHEGKVFDLPHTGAVLRSELDGSNLEVVHTGLRNPQELVFDDYGDLFTGDNNSDGGDEARWVQIVEGADSGWRFYYQYVTSPVLRGPWNDEQLWKPHHAGQPAYIVPPIANLGSGPSGLDYYPGTGLPEKYAEHFFLCDFRGDKAYSGVHTFTNVRKGAGFELGPVEPFVWKTLVTDCQFGPDGAFYWSDWVHGWGMTGKGRIYRMTSAASDAPLVRETEEILASDFGAPDPERLRALLAHADRRVRQEAHLELARRGADGALLRTAMEGSGLARLHGIWGLGVIARRDAARRDEILTLMLPFMEDDDAEVRAQTARVFGDVRSGVTVDALALRLADDSARVRLHAAIGLGRIGAPAATKWLFGLAADVGDSDPVLRHAAVMGLAGCASDAELRAAVEQTDPDVRMAALLAMRRRGVTDVQLFLSDPEPSIVREAATAIHDDAMAAAPPTLAELAELAKLADLIGRRAKQGFTGNALVRRALVANLMLGGRERADALADYSLRGDQDEAHRAEALALLREWGDPSDIDRVLGCWNELPPRDATYVPVIIAELATRDKGILTAPETVLNAWIEVAGAVRADVAPALRELARDRVRAASTRTAALAGLEALGVPDLRGTVAEALADADGLVRAAALDTLGRLAPADALPLLTQVLERGERGERRAAYRILGRMKTPEAAQLLLAELRKLAADLVPAELALDLVAAAEKNGAEPLGPLLRARADARAADPELAPWLDTLFGGDAANGRRIFREKSEVSCLRCHQTQDDGKQEIGPNLAGIGKRQTRLQMMESIVQPNRRVATGYETETFFLTDGSVLEGRVVGETETAVAIVDNQGAVFDIALADVSERRPGLSAMPNGQTEHMTREELRDLLEYLASL